MKLAILNGEENIFLLLKGCLQVKWLIPKRHKICCLVKNNGLVLSKNVWRSKTSCLRQRETSRVGKWHLTLSRFEPGSAERKANSLSLSNEKCCWLRPNFKQLYADYNIMLKFWKRVFRCLWNQLICDVFVKIQIIIKRTKK